MTPPHKCDFVRRQLPRGPSCQCHALLSYKPRPRPVFRPEAPRECVEELFDEIFRMGTSILIRLGVPIPPVEMAYFDFLNELDAQERTPQHQVDIRQHSEPRIDQDALPETLSGFQYFSTDIVAEPLHTGQQLPFDPFNGPLPELQYPETNADAEPSPQDQPQQEPRLQFPSVPPPDEQPTKACAAIQPQPNPIVRYITGDQLKVMGWKDLFMLARARNIVHGPMMRSKQELVKKFLQRFGTEVPVYRNDKLPKNFPSKYTVARHVCDHVRIDGRQGPVFRK